MPLSSLKAQENSSHCSPKTSPFAFEKIEEAAKSDSYKEIMTELAAKKGLSDLIEKSKPASFEFEPVVAQEFHMGGHEGEKARTVKISKSFEIGKVEVTQLVRYLVTGKNPSHASKAKGFKAFKNWFHGIRNKSFRDSVELEKTKRAYDHPIDWISWKDANAFIEKLNALDSKYVYRLPTDAEWELAAQTYKHDVFEGSLWEWCQDWYCKTPKDEDNLDPAGPISGSEKVLRGGDLSRFGTKFLDLRGSDSPQNRYQDVSLRLVRTLK
ncbi:MAG: hypothetical protein JWQ35_1862 [Bacteriovoracaceae bacterium]|nr:hypothetical protein [Bacteriovoracaceae bacterium]